MNFRSYFQNMADYRKMKKKEKTIQFKIYELKKTIHWLFLGNVCKLKLEGALEVNLVRVFQHICKFKTIFKKIKYMKCLSLEFSFIFSDHDDYR